MARSENRPVTTLTESDYLLGVYDGHRMGAIRFKEDPDGPFLNNNETFASPSWTSIKELEQISLSLEDDNSLDLDLTLEVADYFRLDAEDALRIIEDIKNL